MKTVMLHACKNIESLLIEEINEKLEKWHSEHSNVEIVSVSQMITLIPQIGCPDLLLTLVMVYKPLSSQ